jgi:hypothetical protein
MADEMKITALSVDLLQGQAAIALVRQSQPSALGRPNFTAININVPIATQVGESESQLRRSAVEQAKQALQEAIKALNDYQRA